MRGYSLVGSTWLGSSRLHGHLVRLLTDPDLIGDRARDRSVAALWLCDGIDRLGRRGCRGRRLAHVLGTFGPLGEKLGGHLGKHGVCENIFISSITSFQSHGRGPQLLPFGLLQVGR